MSEFRTAPEGAYCSSYYPEFSERAVPPAVQAPDDESKSHRANRKEPEAA
jgi:hypothetical protein